MLQLTKLDHTLWFPDPNLSAKDPNGLLAFAGDLSIDRLKLAYRSGIFPWFSEGEPILWWSPNPRGIVELDQFHCSKSLKKFVKANPFRVTLNHAFEQVIQACATIPRGSQGTWITPKMINAYVAFHHAGHAHSIEVWDRDQLIGGLYGVVSGKVFCGESMFHKVTNASKLAFFYLVEHLRNCEFDFIDCQMQNPHLKTLGCKEIPRETFLQRLDKSASATITRSYWSAKTLKK